MKKWRSVMALILAMLMLLSTLSGCCSSRKDDTDLSPLTPSSSVEETTGAEEGEEKPGEEKADREGEDEEPEEADEGEKTEPETLKQNSGISLGGTRVGASFDIRMSDSYTFSDPAGLSFGTRYVLYGGSRCMFAKVASAQGYACRGGYEVLYANGSSPVCEYRFYVMSSISDAKRFAGYLADYYNGGNTSCGRHGDVVYVYYSGSYVQDTINIYYDQGAIDAKSVKAYLRMPFFFNGMSEYHGAGAAEKVQKPAPAPDTPDAPEPLPMPSEDNKEFSLKISDSYTFTDPKGLHFDTRYVLHGDASCSTAGTVSKSAGVSVKEVYDILYTENGAPVKEFVFYVTADNAEARKIADTYQNGAKAIGDVAIMKNSAETVQQTISYLAYVGMETSVAGYLQYLVSSGGMNSYAGGDIVPVPDKPDPTPTEPEPDPAPVDPDPAEPVFALTDPAGLDYDTRYVLSGDSGNPYAAQYGAERVYIVFYAKEGNILGEYLYYVMDSVASAETLAGEKEGWTTDANAACTSFDGAYVQSCIDLYAQYGLMSEATLDAYVQLFVSGYGLTLENTILPEPEFALTDPAGLDYDTRYVLSGDSGNPYAAQYGAERVYIVFYAKEGNILGEYLYYVMDSVASAETLAGEKEGWTTDANAACTSFDGAYVQSCIDLYAQYGLMSEATLDAYVQLFVSGYGLTLESAILPEPEPEPEPQPQPEPEPVVDPKAIKLSESYTFTDPEGISYDTRYVLHGSSSAAAAVSAATGTSVSDVYDVIYVKDDAPVKEFQCYVTTDAAAAQKIADTYQNGMKTEGDVAIMENSAESVQQMIGYMSYFGEEATLEGYIRYMLANGYTYFNGSPQLPEVTAEPSETNEEEGAERSRSDAAQPEQPVEAPEEEPENGAAPEDESAQPTEDGSAQNDDPGAAPEE